MTPTEQIEYLATKVMGWHEGKARRCGVCRWWWDESEENYMGARYARCDDYDEVWNPLTDWNHWRQVEEKVMEDEKLWRRFILKLVTATDTQFISNPEIVIKEITKADLPTRVSALIAAHKELTPSQPEQ